MHLRTYMKKERMMKMIKMEKPLVMTMKVVAAKMTIMVTTIVMIMET